MNIPGMIQALRTYGNTYGKNALTDAEGNALADFLANLPTIPEGYRWDGTIRRAVKNEETLDADGGVATWPLETESQATYPILRKLPPQFKPGEIVTNGELCRYIDDRGERRWWDGTLCQTPGAWEIVNRQGLETFLRRFPGSIVLYLRATLREKYGRKDK